MRESEVVIISEKIQGEELPRCVYGMYARINNPHNFRVTLAAGERLLSKEKYNQVGTDIKKVPELCNYFDVGRQSYMRSSMEKSMEKRKKTARNL